MTISDVAALFTFIGGVGMFLYGMKMLSDGMQKGAGGKMAGLLGTLTRTPILGVLVGALVTAVIQSSGATTVMVVGFVNAGLMSLGRAVSVIMGANIGTSITAWIVSMSQLGDALQVLQPSFVAPVMLGIGAALSLFSRSQKKQTIGEILLGLGFLFMGLDLMGDSVAPYRESEVFIKVFSSLGSNPVLGLLAGFIVTTIMQSSSASIGVLQMLAANGMVSFGASVYVALGANIGSTVTALISAAGASREGKQAAVIHLMFNVIGAVIFGTILTVVFLTRPELSAMTITPVGISIFHTTEKALNTLLLLPFGQQLVKLSGIIVKDKSKGTVAAADREALMLDNMKRRLDDRFLETGFAALETAKDEVVEMGAITIRNLSRSVEALLTQDQEKIDKTLRTEDVLDEISAMLTGFLVKASNLSLTQTQHSVLNNLFYCVNDIERVGDRAENIAESAAYMKTRGLKFSETAAKELREMADKCIDGMTAAIKARQEPSLEQIRRVSLNEDEVDVMEEELRERHLERLRGNQCDPDTSMSFLDVISNLERISDHAYNIAGYVKDEM